MAALQMKYRRPRSHHSYLWSTLWLIRVWLVYVSPGAYEPPEGPFGRLICSWYHTSVEQNWEEGHRPDLLFQVCQGQGRAPPNYIQSSTSMSTEKYANYRLILLGTKFKDSILKGLLVRSIRQHELQRMLSFLSYETF